MEVGGSARQRLLGGAQGFEGRVPGVGQHDEPDHTRHQGVVHDDEDCDARQRLRRPVEGIEAIIRRGCFGTFSVFLKNQAKCEACQLKTFTYEGSPSRIVLSLLHTISLRAPSRNWASQPILPTKKQALM